MPISGTFWSAILEYPKELHNKHHGYPLAAESMFINEVQLSEYARSFEQKHVETRKLVPKLNNKCKYIAHYRNFKVLFIARSSLDKNSSCFVIDQKPWLKEYIDYNTKRRKLALNAFEKIFFFKLMNNAVFGKIWRT